MEYSTENPICETPEIVSGKFIYIKYFESKKSTLLVLDKWSNMTSKYGTNFIILRHYKLENWNWFRLIVCQPLLDLPSRNMFQQQ